MDMAFGGLFLLLDTPWLFLSACAIGVWGLGGIAHEMYTPDLASMEDVVGFLTVRWERYSGSEALGTVDGLS